MSIVRINTIVCRNTAAPGEELFVGVQVENIDIIHRDIWCYVLSVVGDNTYEVLTQSVYLAPSDTHGFYTYLIMPTIGFELKAWAYWFDYDDPWWKIGDFKNHYTYLSVSDFKSLAAINYNGG